jgi:hypothetical protein
MKMMPNSRDKNMRLILPVVCLLFSCTAGFSQSVKLPEAVKVQPGRLASVKIEYDGDDVKWIVDSKLDIFREFTTDPKQIILRLQGFDKGTYQVIAVACKAGKLSDFAVCLVTVGDPVPPPTPPAPPGPTPPNPGPTPVPPGPVPPTPPPFPNDPVAIRIQTAFKADVEPLEGKVKSCLTLSAFFSAMASHVKDPSVKTVGDLLSDYKAAVPAVLKPTDITGVRKQISLEVIGVAGDDADKAIDPTLRDALIKLFEFLATVLKLLS